MSSTAPHQNKSPAIPRPSASLVVLNDRAEVLLVQRRTDARSFAGAHVFPGGNYDPKNDSNLRETALRETFEEAGILLASGARRPDGDVLDEARKAIHAQRISFRSFLDEHHLKLDEEELLPFTQWVTPPTAPRRFYTQFFVAFLPSSTPSSSYSPSSGTAEQHLPTPDGGLEVLSASFVHLQTVLSQFAAKQLALMPPQFYIVSTLAAILSSCADRAGFETRVRELANGSFGRMCINPRPLKTKPPQSPEQATAKDGDKRLVLTYEGDETRGGSTGRLHRSLVKFGPGGVASEIVLQRNWDVFREVEEHAFASSMPRHLVPELPKSKL